MSETATLALNTAGETHPYLWISRLNPERTGRGEEDTITLHLTERAALLDAIAIVRSLLEEHEDEGYAAGDLSTLSEEDLDWLLLDGTRRLSEHSEARITVHQAVAQEEPMAGHVRRILAEHGIQQP